MSHIVTIHRKGILFSIVLKWRKAKTRYIIFLKTIFSYHDFLKRCDFFILFFAFSTDVKCRINKNKYRVQKNITFSILNKMVFDHLLPMLWLRGRTFLKKSARGSFFGRSEKNPGKMCVWGEGILVPRAPYFILHFNADI